MAYRNTFSMAMARGQKDWWETLAIADADNKYVILPVQFMRGVASNEVERWPHETSTR